MSKPASPIQRWWNDLSLRAKGLTTIAIPLTVLVAAAGAFAITGGLREQADRDVDRSLELKQALDNVFLLLIDGGNGVRGYVLTGRADFLQPYTRSKETLPDAMQRLQRLVLNEPNALRNFRDVVLPSVEERFGVLEELRRAYDVDHEDPKLSDILVRGRDVMDQLRDQFAAMQAEMDRVLQARQAREDRLEHLARSLNLGTIVACPVFGVLAVLVFTHGITRRISQLICATEALERDQPLGVLPDGFDEVGQLGQALRRASGLLAARRAESEKAQTELQNEHAFLSAMLAHATDGIVVCDHRGRITVFNRAAREFHGLAEDGPIPERWSDHCELFEGDGETPLLPEEIPLARAFKGGEVRSVEVVIAPRNAPRRTVLCSGRRIVGENGRRLGAVVIMHDMTGWAQLKAALRETEERFKAFMDNTPAVAYIKDSEGRYIYINRKFSRCFEVTPEELLGQTDFEWLPAEIATELTKTDRVVLETGRSLERTEHMTLSNGVTTHWLALKFPVVDSLGRKYLAGVAVDISERTRALNDLRVSEARYGRIAANVPGMVYQCVLGSDGSVTFPFVSEGCREIFGVEPQDVQLNAHALLRMVHPRDRRVFLRSVRRSHTSLVPWKWEGRVLLADGTVKWVQGASRPERQENGGTIWDGVAMDVTARKNAEARLRAFAGELERSNQALQEFAYVASHDLQEPLRKIRTFGEMMRKSCLSALPKEGAFFLERMEHAANRMQTLIRDLLALSRVSTAGEEFTTVDLSEVAREVVSDLEGRLQKDGGNVILEPLPVLSGDPTQMRQLLQNLIGNALKFQRPGVPPVVQVRARQYENDAGRGSLHGASTARWCELSVEDNGIGFEQKHAERVFAPFQRLHGKDAYEGTGMGLSICRKIAERHGGTIIARSKPGEGAIFTVTLPLDRKSSSHVHE